VNNRTNIIIIFTYSICSIVDGKKQKPCDKQTSGLPEYKNNDIQSKINEENARWLPKKKNNEIKTEIHEEKAQTSGLPENNNNDIKTNVVKKVAPKQKGGIGKIRQKGAKSSNKRGTTGKQ
jgi:hypothetical protein